MKNRRFSAMLLAVAFLVVTPAPARAQGAFGAAAWRGVTFVRGAARHQIGPSPRVRIDRASVRQTIEAVSARGGRSSSQGSTTAHKGCSQGQAVGNGVLVGGIL